MGDATVYFYRREPGTDDWELDGSPVRSQEDLAHTGEQKARAHGEEWVARDPEHHRYEVRPH